MRDTIDRFLTDLEHVVDDVFDRLDSTYSIDSTHIEAIQYNDAASWNYNSTAEEHYYGFGCTIVSTGSKIPIAAEFTQTKQADQETAMRVTRDALAVETPTWMLGDSAYDILDWHDPCGQQVVVPVAPYNLRNADDSDVYQLQLTVSASDLLINTVGINAVPQDEGESVQQNVGVSPTGPIPPGPPGAGNGFEVTFNEPVGDSIRLTFQNNDDVEVEVTRIRLDSYTDASGGGNQIDRIVFQDGNTNPVLMENGQFRDVDIQPFSSGTSRDYTISARRPAGQSGNTQQEPIDSGDEFTITLQFRNRNPESYTITVP